MGRIGLIEDDYFDSLLSVSGCDSVLLVQLSVNPTFVSNSALEICEEDSILIHGVQRKTAGIYTDTLTSIEGCDSILNVELIVNPIYELRDTITICEGDSALLFGEYRFTTGEYGDTAQTIKGCDSLNYTQLFVNSNIQVAQTVSICDGDSLFVQKAYQFLQGVYRDTFVSSFGCDSIRTTNLFVNPVYFIQQNSEICANDSILIGNTYQSTTGVYYDSLFTFKGCDSIIEIDLLVNPTFSETQVSSVCMGDSILFEGTYYSVAGVYVDSLLTVKGCDSLSILNLSILPTYSSTISIDICQGDSALIFGNYEMTQGVYTDSMLTQNGCDSIEVVALNVLPTYSSTISVDICQGDSVLIFGNYEMTQGVYTDSMLTQNGCDSIEVVALNLLLTYSSTISVDICQGDSALIFGDYEMTQGIYTDSMLAQNGCDSIEVVELNVATGLLQFQYRINL